MEQWVLSGIEAIEPRIIRTAEQKLAIFERGIGERNYILWNRVQWIRGQSLKVEYLCLLWSSTGAAASV